MEDLIKREGMISTFTSGVVPQTLQVVDEKECCFIQKQYDYIIVDTAPVV
jgi:cellulose biosynthesis protein BcsQ